MPKRARWADLRDDSNEAFTEEPRPAPLADASYCEPPLSDLAENSQGTLNQRIRCAVGLDGGAGAQPMDVALLLGPDCASARSAPPSVPSAPSVTSAPPMSQSPVREGTQNARAAMAADVAPLNADAREFIPMSMAAPTSPRDFAFLLGTDANAAPVTPTSPAPVPRRRIAGKRCPAAVAQVAQIAQARAGKRPRAESTGASASSAMGVSPASTISPTSANKNATGAVASTSSSAIAVVASEEASEEDWQRRIEKRQAWVAIVKASAEYIAFRESEEPLLVPAPRTPDPTDLAVSKRSWEEQVRKWRASLREWGPDNGQEP